MSVFPDWPNSSHGAFKGVSTKGPEAAPVAILIVWAAAAPSRLSSQLRTFGMGTKGVAGLLTVKTTVSDVVVALGLVISSVAE